MWLFDQGGVVLTGFDLNVEQEGGKLQELSIFSTFRVVRVLTKVWIVKIK